jgi:tetratricopeptide (TPR) repeat protein
LIGRLLPLLAAGLLLAGCASTGKPGGPSRETDLVTTARQQGLPLNATVEGVPFYSQQTNLCGPAALASTLQFAGVNASPQALAPQVYTPALKGSLQFDLLGATRKAGRIPYVIRPTLQALFKEVASGNPVLVLQDVGLLSEEWHFAVVTGYNLETGQVNLHSGNQAHLLLSVSAFDRSWAAGQRWGFVVLRPGQLPASASEADYLKAVQPLESIHPEIARSAYQAGLQQWPGSLVALIGLGNLAYRDGQFTEAENYFRQAASSHPDSGDALNNLAEALLAQNRLTEALEAVRKAMGQDGPHAAMYETTKEEIERKLQSLPQGGK